MKKFVLLMAALILMGAAAAQKPLLEPARKMAYAAQIIETFYVDTVDTTEVVEEGIRGMLKTLDPHSQYTDAEATQAVNEPLEGNFSGIGIRFQVDRDTLYVVEVIKGGPSEKVGLQPGDRITECNDTVMAGVNMKNREIVKLLRGKKGTSAVLKVKRHGVKDLITFRVVRDDIPINSLDAAYIINDSVGYISLSRFGANTADEVSDAIGKMRRQGVSTLIVDLKDNGGGYLRSATGIAGFFLNKGDMITYTEGRSNGRTDYRSEEDGLFSDGRVIVMINQNSASASEILSGAIQDNDRGVVVGRRSFGKGLVQRPFPFPDGSMIRLTVARYHTPSGRCIQKPYTDGADPGYSDDILIRYRSGELEHADSVHLPDSLLYHTLKLGRPVYGGGGIMPDVFVPIDTTMFSPAWRDLVAKGVLTRWCRSYLDTHRKALHHQYRKEKDFLRSFEVTAAMRESLLAAARADSIDTDSASIARSLPLIDTNIKGLLARDLYGQSSYYRIVNQLNPIYLRAVEIATKPREYFEILRKH